MSRRPAYFTQADVARILRAAKQVGAKTAQIQLGDTTVTVSLDQIDAPTPTNENRRKVVL